MGIIIALCVSIGLNLLLLGLLIGRSAAEPREEKGGWMS